MSESDRLYRGRNQVFPPNDWRTGRGDELALRALRMGCWWAIAHLGLQSFTCHVLLDFRKCSSARLEHLGDTTMDVQRREEAISHYSATLSFGPHKTFSSSEATLTRRMPTAAASWRFLCVRAPATTRTPIVSPCAYIRACTACNFKTLSTPCLDDPSSGPHFAATSNT